jgi:hypothetical protein
MRCIEKLSVQKRRKGGGRPGRLPGAQARGGARQGCRQGNGELVVVWWVACGKKCEKSLKKKKKKVKIFWTEILEVGLRVLKKVAKYYSGQPRPETNFSDFSVRPWGGGAKFISSPWAQKWLATALYLFNQVLCASLC